MDFNFENNGKSGSGSGSGQSVWVGVSQEITANELRDFATRNFDRIDTNQNGFLTRREVQDARRQDGWSEQEQTALDRMITNYDTMARADGAYRSWSAQITPSSMARYAEVRNSLTTESQDVQRALQYGRDNFDRLDANRDGFIDMNELRRAQQTPETTRLMSNYNGIQQASNDEWGPENNGITRKDLDKYHEQWLQETHTSRRAGCGCALCTAGGGGYRLSRQDFLK